MSLYSVGPSEVQGQNIETLENTKGAVTKIDLRWRGTRDLLLLGYSVKNVHRKNVHGKNVHKWKKRPHKGDKNGQFSQLLKTHLFCWGRRRLVTVGFLWAL